jgi:hypothetical protein
MKPALPGFVPLMLQPDWLLESHLGWRAIVEQPGLKLLRRPRGPLSSWLLMAHGADAADLDAIARTHRLLSAHALLTLVDFSADALAAAAPRQLAGHRLAPVTRARFFGVGTFVLDLTLPESVLWTAVAARERGKARQAERAGVQVDVLAPRPDDIDELAQAYARMARARALEPLAQAPLHALQRAGHLLLARTRDGNGQTLALTLALSAHDQGYFLHGVRVADGPSGAGVLAQWELARALRARGLRFYDLGLVASTDEADGLFRFKRAFGGTYVPFGSEHRRIPGWLGAPYAAFQRLRQHWRAGGRPPERAA